MDNHSIADAGGNQLSSNALDAGKTVGVVADPGGVIVAKLKGQYHQPNTGLVLHMLQELQYLVNSWQSEIAEIDQKITLVRQAGPVVAGWLEAEDAVTEPPKKFAPPPPPSSIQQKSLDYHLCSLDESGSIATRDCPEPEMFGISKALARHQQLRELLDRKSTLEANIKHTLATLVHLRMEIN